ncbi:MAG TPA: dephospho-CoA kinase [Epsilonproteobacteria bacterium]|nr:dephospho-CoA kinase [Campylobacterota bacterium]
MAFKYAIALTGSIATGKSTVAKFFTLFGFTVIDADQISHDILDAQQFKIAQLFGEHLVKEGKVDRKALGRIVFSDTDKRKKLEGLLHPLIFDEIKCLSEEEEKLKKPYFVDIPLFFENERYPITKSLVVYTPKYIQLKRLVLRDGYNEEEALNRIEMQIDIEEKRKRASYVVDNTDDLIALKHECMRVKEKIEKDFS